jgi:hypothetical protein
VTTSASHHTWSRVTGLQDHRHCTAPGTAASVLRRSCLTHRATGCLDSPAAISHTLGNWRSCCTPPLPRSCSTTRRPLSEVYSSSLHQLSSDHTLRPGNSRQPPHCTRRPPHATSQPTRLHNFSQQPFLPAHTPLHHSTDVYSTTSPAGTNGPLQGPTNFTEWIVLIEQRHPHRFLRD